MKHFVAYLVIVLVAFSSSATTVWTLQNKEYNIDTINHIVVGPSTTLTSLRLTGAQNLNIFYTVTDLTNPILDIRTLKAKNTIYARQEVSGMALDHDNDSTQYFLGVNADFFNMRKGNSIGSHVIDSQPIYVDNNGRTQWTWSKNRQPIMDEIKITHNVIMNNSSILLSGINTTASKNSITLYTPLYGAKTDSVATATEVVISPIDFPVTIGKTSKMIVTSTPKTGGATSITPNSYVLSGTDFQGILISRLKQGDVIEISSTASLSNGAPITPTELISGYPVILQNGVTTNPVDILHHLNDLHPRTAIGSDESNSKLIILIVDGRSKDSDGCTSKVLADIMRYVGCYNAMNFDGGGSSELYIKNLGICNVPSDGKERTVANGLYVVAKVPTDNKIASIAFAQSRTSINKGDTYTPIIYGYNKYGVLINTNVDGIELSFPKKFGKIKGNSLIAETCGENILTAHFGELSTSTQILIE